jgi:hypothetical protein
VDNRAQIPSQVTACSTSRQTGRNLSLRGVFTCLSRTPAVGAKPAAVVQASSSDSSPEPEIAASIIARNQTGSLRLRLQSPRVYRGRCQDNPRILIPLAPSSPLFPGPRRTKPTRRRVIQPTAMARASVFRSVDRIRLEYFDCNTGFRRRAPMLKRREDAAVLRLNWASAARRSRPLCTSQGRLPKSAPIRNAPFVQASSLRRH